MSGKAIELTDATFEETLKKGGILFIDFWAQWCPPCRAFAPVFEAAAEKHPDITFAKVNSDEQRGLAQAFEVRAIPTLAIFRDGILLSCEAGALPAASLESVVTQVRALDMEKVKKEVAEQQKK
ncbi:MAG: thioredoxin family protein [Myxococcaceae bacterium]|nr:thioredoxin family protein [Myxococcaceae bacterium]